MKIEINSELGKFIAKVDEKTWTLTLPWLKQGDKIAFYLNDNNELEIRPIKKLPPTKKGKPLRRANER